MKLGQNYSTTLVGADRVKAIQGGIAEVLGKVQEPGRPDLAAAIQNIAFQYAQGYESRTLSTAQRMELATAIAQSAVSILSSAFQEADVKAQSAATALRDAEQVFESERSFFQSLEPERIDKSISTMDLAAAERGFAGLGGLATIFAGRLHDGWFRVNVTTTARGEGQDGTEFRVRPDYVPFSVAENEMEKGGAAELQRFTQILTRSAVGLVNASDALLDVAAGSAVPQDRAGYLGAEERSLLLPPEVRRRLHAIGYALFPLWEQSANSAPAGIPFDAPEHAEVKRVLEAIHKRFSLNNPGYVPFDQETPARKAGNIPTLLAVVDGVLSADRLSRRILDYGIVGPHGVAGEAFLLQRHLFHSVKVAQGLSQGGREFKDINRVLARGVADEAALLAAHAAGVRSNEGVKLDRIYGVFFEAVERAGNEFRPGGRGASGAAEAALAAAPKLLGAMQAKGKKTTPAGDLGPLRKHAESLVERATGGDLLAILRDEFGRSDVSAADFAKMKVHADADAYFKPKFEAAKGLSVEEPALSPAERKELAQILRLANATWKVGQGHLVMAKGDDSRGSPTERGSVFNPYDLLLASFKDPSESLFVGPVKDWLILKGALEASKKSS